jgi:hypothetical protein
LRTDNCIALDGVVEAVTGVYENKLDINPLVVDWKV